MKIVLEAQKLRLAAAFSHFKIIADDLIKLDPSKFRGNSNDTKSELFHKLEILRYYQLCSLEDNQVNIIVDYILEVHDFINGTIPTLPKDEGQNKKK